MGTSEAEHGTAQHDSGRSALTSSRCHDNRLPPGGISTDVSSIHGNGLNITYIIYILSYTKYRLTVLIFKIVFTQFLQLPVIVTFV